MQRYSGVGFCPHGPRIILRTQRLVRNTAGAEAGKRASNKNLHQGLLDPVAYFLLKSRRQIDGGGAASGFAMSVFGVSGMFLTYSCGNSIEQETSNYEPLLARRLVAVRQDNGHGKVRYQTCFCVTWKRAQRWLVSAMSCSARLLGSNPRQLITICRLCLWR